jgi:hypothetical protein
MSHHSPNPDLSDRYGADSNRRITRKAKITLPPGEGGVGWDILRHFGTTNGRVMQKKQGLAVSQVPLEEIVGGGFEPPTWGL